MAQSSDSSGPFSFDRGPPFELEAEFAKEINRPSEVFDDDPYVVHPLERHVPISKMSFQSPRCCPVYFSSVRSIHPVQTVTKIVMVLLGTTIHDFASAGAVSPAETRGWSGQVRP